MGAGPQHGGFVGERDRNWVRPDALALTLDRRGILAAGTSTGGTQGKLAGRVGDSPVIGASTHANAHVALSATVAAEVFTKRGVTRDIVARDLPSSVSEESGDYVVKELIGTRGAPAEP